MDMDADGAEQEAAPQHSAATKPALRGPTRSSQPPKSAADKPRNTMNNVNIIVSMLTDQSHCVVNSSVTQRVPGAQASGLAMPGAFDNGSQNTLKPYAMPMHRWMHSAATGTSQQGAYVEDGRAGVQF
jgi:hypothetical protein